MDSGSTISGLPSYEPESLCVQCRSIDIFPMVKQIPKVAKNYRGIWRTMNFGKAISIDNEHVEAGGQIWLGMENCHVWHETIRGFFESASSGCSMCSRFVKRIRYQLLAMTDNMENTEGSAADDSNDDEDDEDDDDTGVHSDSGDDDDDEDEDENEDEDEDDDEDEDEESSINEELMNYRLYISIETHAIETKTMFFRIRILNNPGDFILPPLYYGEVIADREALPTDSDLFLGRSVYPSFEMERNGAIAKSWIHNCVQNHDKCNVPPMQPPTRLIDVSYDKPRLVEPKGKNVQWTSLSYCWGPPPWTTVRKDNIDRWKEGVSLDEFPQTLKDAVLFTRALGCRYIWIDALCIIQGSKEDGGDFFSEAGRMKDYYRGALVTITAATSTNSSEGFTQPRDLSSKDIFAIPWFHPKAPSQQVVYVRPEYRRNTVWSWEDGSTCLLNTRGWTLQESIIPPRTVITSSKGLLWMCTCESRGESGQVKPYSGIDLKSLVHQMAAVKESNLKKISSKLLYKLQPLEYPSKEKVPYIWAELVDMFSTRNLTNYTDSLSAIASIVRVFQEFTHDAYWAGIWKSRIAQELQWQRKPPWVYLREADSDDGKDVRYDPNKGIWDDSDETSDEEEEEKEEQPHSIPKLDPNIYIGPSWSWVSMTNSKVSFLYEDEDISSLVSFADVKVSLATDDPFGRINSAELTIEAPFHSIRDPSSEPTDSTPSHGLPKFHKWLRKVFARPTEAFEYEQKHRPYDGQQFAALQLCKALESTSGYFSVMILESVIGTDQWRRIGLLLIRGKYNHTTAEPTFQNEVYEEIKGTPWKKRKIVII